MDMFYTKLIASSLLAANGFIANSLPALIGAMLIAPFAEPLVNLMDGGSIDSNLFRLAMSFMVPFVVGYLYLTFYNHTINQYPVLGTDVDKTQRTSLARWSMGNYFNQFIYAIVCGYLMSFGNSAGMTTVAGYGIGLSLLPPMVNSGMYFAENRWIESRNSLIVCLANVFGIILGYNLGGAQIF